MSMFSRPSVIVLCSLALGICLSAQAADDDSRAPLPEILDEPRTIDPADLVPALLSVRATQDFTESSLREVIQWLRTQNLAVLLDQRSLADARISLAEPISDRLEDAPLYLILNRLRSLGLAWYFDEQVLHITSAEEAETHLTTLPYNVGDLLDSGYELPDLEVVIQHTISPEAWESVGGPGGIHSLGDVMFVRQTDATHRAVRGLLAALRNHARRTFVNDPEQHVLLRNKLDENVDADFQNTPLETAIQRLSETAGIDIRLDTKELREFGIHVREAVTLSLSERKLETILHAVALDFDLTWTLKDGVLWLTTPEATESSLKTAVYDVRDLCRDRSESDALVEAITSQASPEFWETVGGPSSAKFARPGTMVISSTEEVHAEILELLESYRVALRSSRPRERYQRDPNEVTTVYYRLHDSVARSLENSLPRLVKPDSWKSGALPAAPGEITRVASPPEVSDRESVSTGFPPEVINRAVLIIQQTREVHDQIADIIRRVRLGDGHTVGFAAGGFGGGGFGGGYFAVESNAP